MQTLTIQVTSNNGLKALHALEDKHYIKIVEDTDLDSPSHPGSALSIKAFKSWIEDAENMPSIDLKDAKSKWAQKRKQLEKLIR